MQTRAFFLLISGGLGALLAPGVASAGGCPAPSTDYVQRVVDRAILVGQEGEKVRRGDPLASLLEARFHVDTARLPDALEEIALETTGRGMRQTPLGFGDVAFRDGVWFVHLYGQVELAIELSSGQGALVEVPRAMPHQRICAGLADAWDLASAQSPEHTAEPLAAAVSEHAVPLAELPFGQPEEEVQPKERKSTDLRLGASVGYDQALGDQTNRVFASTAGGQAWIGRPLQGPWGFRLAARYGRVDSQSVSWGRWAGAGKLEGELSTAHWRLEPMATAAISPIPGLELTGLLGPSFGIFQRTIVVDQVPENERKEFVFGVAGGPELTAWMGKSQRTGLTLELHGGLWRHRAPDTDPLAYAGFSVGMAHRGKK